MKILFCSNNISGMILFRNEVMQHFIERDHDVVVVAPRDATDFNADLLPSNIIWRPVKMNRTSMNPFLDIKYMASLIKLFRQEKPDYIFNYTIKPNIYGSIAAKMMGIPCSSMMAGLGYAFSNDSLLSKIARMFYRVGLLCSQHLLLLNESNVQMVKSLGLCDEHKIEFLEGGEGVDLDFYKFYNNQSETTTFLFIARLIEEKGYKDFVEAAKIVKKQFPDCKFQVIGSFDLGYPQAVTQDQIRNDEHDHVIEYLGTIKDIRNVYMKPGYVICIPSYYSEGLNRSLMEGCSVGKPIITTNHPGCREMVTDGVNGYLVQPKDPIGLADAMMRYIRLSPEDKERMSIESRKLAERRFNVDNVIEVYDRIIRLSVLKVN